MEFIITQKKKRRIRRFAIGIFRKQDSDFGTQPGKLHKYYIFCMIDLLLLGYEEFSLPLLSDYTVHN